MGIGVIKMTVYEIPNIEHCTVDPVGDPVIGYTITSHNGWYIHINDGFEEGANIYKTCVALRYDHDWSDVQIVAEADLPPEAEICGDVKLPVETE